MISQVQFNHAYVATAATFTGNVTVGNLIVVAASTTNGVSGSMTASDNLGNTYHPITSANADVGGTHAYLFYAVVTTGGACTVTIAQTNLAGSDPGLTVAEYSGLSTTPTVTGYPTGTNSGSPIEVSVSATAGDLIFLMWANENVDSYVSPTAGFTTFQHDSGHYDAQADYQNVASTGVVTAGVNYSGTENVIIAADFTPALSGGTTTSTSSTSSSSSTSQSTSTSISSTSTSTTQSFTTSTSSTSSSTSVSSTSQSTSTSISSTSSSTSTSQSSTSTSASTSTSHSSTSTSFSTSTSTSTSSTSTSVSSTSTSLSTTTTLAPDQTQPIGTIRAQILSSTPIGIETTLVDDPVALVDDPKALVGSQTTQIPFLRTDTDSNAPTAFIRKRR